jgi:peptidoglycan/xylan/chitin deacetylase (PgdA/CDA1 family)
VVVAVAGAVVIALIVTGVVLGRSSIGTVSGVAHSPTPAVPRPTVPTVPATPTPSPQQAIGLQAAPPVPAGTGPFGSIIGTGTRTVALTFDDGPDPQWTPMMLEVLRRSGVKATFCLVGQNAEAYPDLVRAIAAEGHTLCNHSWDHNLALGRLSRAAIQDDMARTSAAIMAAVPGAHISYFRAPGGNWTASIVAVARALGMTSLDWTVDPRDWTVPPVASIVSIITNSCQDGVIILMHDAGGNRKNSVEAVSRFLPGLALSHTFVALPNGAA